MNVAATVAMNDGDEGNRVSISLDIRRLSDFFDLAIDSMNDDSTENFTRHRDPRK